jgi:hypothetical protein
MIIEQPVITLLDVEVQTPAPGLVLGVDTLGSGELGSGAPPTWVPYLGHATHVGGTRGGKRSGVSNTMAVGMLNVILKDAGDPTTTPVMRPGTVVRLFSKVADRPIYTGAISDIDMTHDVDKRTNKIITFITLVLVDGVQAHANTTRYGAIAPGGFERWEERIQRLASSSVVPINPPVLDDPVVRYTL